jgi:hypothetical protein
MFPRISAQTVPVFRESVLLTFVLLHPGQEGVDLILVVHCILLRPSFMRSISNEEYILYNIPIINFILEELQDKSSVLTHLRFLNLLGTTGLPGESNWLSQFTNGNTKY